MQPDSQNRAHLDPTKGLAPCFPNRAIFQEVTINLFSGTSFIYYFQVVLQCVFSVFMGFQVRAQAVGGHMQTLQTSEKPPGPTGVQRLWGGPNPPVDFGIRRVMETEPSQGQRASCAPDLSAGLH